MSLLRITLFGCPRIYCCERDTEIRLTRNVQLLLAYLVLERHHIHSREILAGLFWRDQSQERAKACLNTTLWRLRSALETMTHPKVPFLLNHQHGEICFNPQSSYWLDVEDFDRSFEKLRLQSAKENISEQIKIAEGAEQTYVGELLEGFYDDWIITERERLRARYLWILSCLMEAHWQDGNLEGSLYYGQKILQLEPLQEEIYREMMRIFAQAGYRTQALAQYETCRKVLENELNVAPMPETQALYRQIISGELSHPVDISDPAEKSPLVPENNLMERVKTIRQKAINQLEHKQGDRKPGQHGLLRQANEKLNQAAVLAESTHRQILSAIDDIEETLGPME